MDVLVNNAGYGLYCALEGVPQDEARRQFGVNVFGVVRLTRVVLPHVRERRGGTVVDVTSMGGKFYTLLGGWYHSTKFALEALGDCLRLEGRPFGFDVVVIGPVGIRTEWSGIAAGDVAEFSLSGACCDQAVAVAILMRSETMARWMSAPIVVAEAVGKAVTACRPRTRCAAGFSARPLVGLRCFLSGRAFGVLMSRAMSLPR
ncbi:SDR family NAD(P)-dependent oxidoreductase [Streptomyces adustus]|uniref:SDR family NAD(P)-dependent oxidoreductase n=1 Tax=Streptomyces adustus TaxID=1609272 RepID=UPI0035DCB564